MDAVDLEKGTGWSVVLKGRAYEPSHWETDHLRVQPMAEGPHRHWIHDYNHHRGHTALDGLTPMQAVNNQPGHHT